MTKIKAAVVRERGGSFLTEEIKIDIPKEYEILIDVKASGLCHSDLHFANDDYGYDLPSVFGHEAAGIVEKIGERVTEFAVGDHVVACLIQYCNHCNMCLANVHHLCLNAAYAERENSDHSRLTDHAGDRLNQAYGVGGFASKILIHEHQLAKVPHEIPSKYAAIIGCCVITGAGAIINTAKIRPGDSVVIIGLGGVGLSTVAGARISGAINIIVVDIHDDKLEFAKKFGATHFINSTKEDPVKRVFEITGKGADASFEAIGIKKCAEQAIQMTRKGGAAYLIGIHKLDTIIDLPIHNEVIIQGKTVQGVEMGSSNLKKDIPLYAEYFLQGRLNLQELVAQEIHISEVQEYYEKLGQGQITGRTVITAFD